MNMMMAVVLVRVVPLIEVAAQTVLAACMLLVINLLSQV